MPDFMSDMNNLTQSVGNAASSLSNLYQVRASIGTKRVASEVQKKNYDFIMRTKLPLGDPNRISLTDNEDGNYWRTVLENHNQEVDTIINSTRWDGVKGAVAQAVEPIGHQFSLSVADAYAQQEIEKAQVDNAVTYQNEASMISDPDELIALNSKYDEVQNKLGMYSPAQYQKEFVPMQTQALANVLYKNAVSQPVSVSETETKPPDLNSAMDYISNSKATYQAKQAAISSVQGYAKQQTEQFNEQFKRLFTDNKDAGNVDEMAIMQMVANAGFVDPGVKDGAMMQLQGYQGGKYEAAMDTVVKRYYEGGKSDEFRDSSRKAASDELNSLYKSLPEWYKKSPKGEAFIEVLDRRIAGWQLHGMEGGSDPEAALFSALIPQLYDAQKLAAMSDSNTTMLCMMVNEIDNRANEILKTHPDSKSVQSDYNSIRSKTASLFSDVLKNAKNSDGIGEGSAANSLRLAVYTHLDSKEKGMLKDSLKDGTGLTNPEVRIVMDTLNTLVMNEIQEFQKTHSIVTPDDKAKIVASIMTRNETALHNAFRGNGNLPKEDTLFHGTADQALAKDFLTKQKEGTEVSSFSIINGQKTMTPATEAIIKQADVEARTMITRDLGVNASDIIVGENEKGYTTYTFGRVVGGTNGAPRIKTEPATYTLVGVMDDGKPRMAIKNDKVGTIFLDGKMSNKTQKEDKEASQFNQSAVRDATNQEEAAKLAASMQPIRMPTPEKPKKEQRK